MEMARERMDVCHADTTGDVRSAATGSSTVIATCPGAVPSRVVMGRRDLASAKRSERDPAHGLGGGPGLDVGKAHVQTSCPDSDM